MDKRLILIISAVFIGLGIMWQAQTIFGDHGIMASKQLDAELSDQVEQIERLTAENKRLKAEIYELKHGFETVESIARQELGMIKEGETLFLYGDSKSEESQSSE